MSLNKQPKTSLGHLPKSVKVRSTCNACQQAKIRCSHEKPSCRRCQKHKIDCIYSVSRRLGRPAKKKDPRPELQERSGTLSSNTAGHPDREKKIRKCAKRKGNCATSTTPVRPRTSRAPAKPKVEDQPQPSILETGVNDQTGFEIDFSSDNWLQELMPPSFEPDPGNLTLESLYGELDMEDTFDAISECERYPVSLFSQPAADMYLCSASSGPHMALAQMTFDSDINALSNPIEIDQSESMMFESAGSVAWPYDPASRLRVQSLPNPWTAEKVAPMEIPSHLSNNCNNLQSPGISQESDTFSQDAGYFAVLEGGPAFSCSCYKQAMSELVRSGLRTSPDGLSSIESILTCQKDLLLQTESILQCKVCSQTEGQANLLMVIILTIDSLLTTLDTTATLAKAEVEDEISSSEDQLGIKKQKEPGGGLKSRIDACPLLVGAFTVPPEEKICFIRQVLQARLSMLLMTIRRIRLSMQEHLTGALSRGRLLMIMETDRRLQLIMMKVKMAVG